MCAIEKFMIACCGRQRVQAPTISSLPVDRAEALLSNSKNANGSSRLFLDAVPIKWVAPPCDFYKVNFDVWWTKELNGVGAGVVQDHRGELYAALCNFRSKVSSVE